MHVHLNKYNVMDHGAAGNGIGLDTAAIQSAIDSCSLNGGGTVYFPNGTYVSGTIYMKSNVTLYLEVSANLLGSPDIKHYALDTHKQRYDHESHMDRCLIYASNVKNIEITGLGTINGQGQFFPNPDDSQRPMMLRFLHCKNIKLKNLRLQGPASWTAAFISCDTIFADSLDIWSRVNENGDGLDFDSCQNVFVSNCKFDTSDDCICLQNSEKDHPCRNVVIQNCIMHAKWAAIRIGVLSSGDMEDVTVSNCIFHDIDCSGLKIQSTEGGHIRNMLFENIVMRNVPRPLFLTYNHFHMGVDALLTPPETGGISNLKFNNISVVWDEGFQLEENSGVIITGVPNHCIDHIEITNMSYSIRGGGQKPGIAIQDVPEMTNTRPEAYVYANKLPTCGIYIRHVKQLMIRNFQLKVYQADEREVFVCDDVEDLDVDGFNIEVPGKPDSLFLFHDVKTAYLNRISLKGEGKTLFTIEGSSENIVISNNDFRRFDEVVRLSNSVTKDKVISMGNLENRLI